MKALNDSQAERKTLIIIVSSPSLCTKRELSSLKAWVECEYKYYSSDSTVKHNTQHWRQILDEDALLGRGEQIFGFVVTQLDFIPRKVYRMSFSFPYFSEPPMQICKLLWEAGRKVGQFVIG